MQVEAHIFSFPLLFPIFPPFFRVLIISFSSEEQEVVCKAKRPKYSGAIQGRSECGFSACHLGLAGAQSKLTYR